MPKTYYHKQENFVANQEVYKLSDHPAPNLSHISFLYQSILSWSKIWSTTLCYVGSYTDFIGLRIVHEDVAKYISRRDGYPADPDDIILTNGGSIGIQVGY